MTLLPRDKLGRVGEAGVVLAIACLYFYFALLLPAKDRLALAEAEGARLARAAAGERAPSAKAPPVSAIPELLKRLNGIAADSGLEVGRVTYAIKDSAGSRRLDVSVPVVGDYPAIRYFMRDALALTATATLVDLNLQRGEATDPAVTAQVGLAYRFEARP